VSGGNRHDLPVVRTGSKVVVPGGFREALQPRIRHGAERGSAIEGFAAAAGARGDFFSPAMRLIRASGRVCGK